MIGCDPGVNNLFTGLTLQGEFRQASTREYYHGAKMHQQRHRNNRLVAKEFRYKEILESIETLTVSSSELFQKRAFHILQCRDELFNFMLSHAFLKWKFKTKRFVSQVSHWPAFADVLWEKLGGKIHSKNPP